MTIYSNLKELAPQLPLTGSLLGIDHGKKFIGIAVSDHARQIASPITTVTGKKFQFKAAKIIKIVKEWNVVGIVLGLPLNMEGSQGPQCQAVRAFAYNLNQLIELPISFIDERLSSSEAEQKIIEMELKSSARKTAIHQIAAATILQWALDEIRTVSSDR